MITVVGYDGSPLAPAACAALRGATLVVGGRRHLDAVAGWTGARTVVMGNVDPAIDAVLAHDGHAVVLASGDPGFFGIVRRLRAAGVRPVVHPAVSSVAMAFARVGEPWDDAVVVSAHGRDPRPALTVARTAPKVAVLTDAVTGPREVAAAVGAMDRRIVVCESLGEPDERVSELSAREVGERDDWRQPNVVLVLDGEPGSEPVWRAGPQPTERGWALPDDAFDHRDGMVTKAEVRAWVLARLQPAPGTLVWDVGAGSGSVAVECARLGAAVVAVERDEDQCRRIEANARTHGVAVEVVHGIAPDALADLPHPDAVFVGGGGLDVVQSCAARRPARLVVALAAVERVGPVFTTLTAAGYAVEGTSIGASRLAALPDGTHRLAALNPVVVVTGSRQ